MRLDHPNYIKLAIAAYHEKRLNNELSPLLMHSTPANIRRECATVYQERYDKKDEPMLRAFFGPAEPGRKFLTLIENFDVNRLRPLDSFLKEEGKKEITEKLQEESRRGITDRNLELLAWLIDFKYRPFVFGMEVFLTDKERQVLGIEIPGNIPEKEKPVSNPEQEPNDGQKFGGKLEKEVEVEKNTPGKEDDKTPVIVIVDANEAAGKNGNSGLKDPKWKKPAAVGLITAALLGTIYIGSQVITTQKQDCLCWTADHYQKVPCDTIIKDKPVLSFDKSLENLKLITQVDTISEWSIGKVHYIKDSGIKYYTGAGLYPEDPTRPLKKLSRYMFDKYLRKKAVPDKDSIPEQYRKSFTKK